MPNAVAIGPRTDMAPAAMELVLRRLRAWRALDPTEEAAVLSCPLERRRYSAETVMLAEGGAQGQAAFLVKGWAACQRVLPGGRRQVLWLALPGDIVGLDAGRGPRAWSVVALSPVELVSAKPVVEAALSGQAPNLARALALSVRQEERLLLDQVVRLGRLVGLERVAHLLLELRDRLRVVGLGDARRFPLPLTQELLADTLGISTVHVNRILKELRLQGLLELRSGVVTLPKPTDLERIALRETSALSPALTG